MLKQRETVPQSEWHQSVEFNWTWYLQHRMLIAGRFLAEMFHLTNILLQLVRNFTFHLHEMTDKKPPDKIGNLLVYSGDRCHVILLLLLYFIKSMRIEEWLVAQQNPWKLVLALRKNLARSMILVPVYKWKYLTKNLILMAWWELCLYNTRLFKIESYKLQRTDKESRTRSPRSVFSLVIMRLNTRYDIAL